MPRNLNPTRNGRVGSGMGEGYSQDDVSRLDNALKAGTDELVSAGIAISRQTKSRPKSLYHYTDAQALMGIVDNQELWLTHASFLNDTTELEWASKIFGEVIDEISGKDTDLANLAERIKYAGDFKDSGFSVFVSSFSENPDDLSQWRGYGGQYNPVCIGFDAERLERRFPFAELLSVIYDVDTQRDIARRIVTSVFDFYKNNHQSDNPASASFYIPHCVRAYRSMSAYAYLRFKAPHWHSEREWRLIVARSHHDRDDMPISFRNGPVSIVPFLKMKVRGYCVPIDKIITGPTTNRHLAAEGIQLYLNGRPTHMMERVAVSEVSLR